MSAPIRFLIDGMTVEVRVEQDDDGASFVRIGGIDCDLEGVAPGEYYPVPHRQRERAR